VRPFDKTDITGTVVGYATAKVRAFSIIDINYVTTVKFTLNLPDSGGKQAPVLLS